MHFVLFVGFPEERSCLKPHGCTFHKRISLCLQLVFVFGLFVGCKYATYTALRMLNILIKII